MSSEEQYDAHIVAHPGIHIEPGSPLDTELRPKPMTRFQEKAVDYVNPKLRNFTDPWAVAKPVLCCTFFFFIIILMASLMICPVNHPGLTIASKSEHKKKVDTGTVDCMYMIVYIASAGMGYKNMMAEHGCNPGDLNAFADGLEWCPGHTVEDNIAKYGAGVGLDCPGGIDNALYGAYYKEKLCPSFGTAFGTSLAYASMLETLFTMIFLGCFVKCGKIKPLYKDAKIMATTDLAIAHDREIRSLQTDMKDVRRRVGAPETSV